MTHSDIKIKFLIEYDKMTTTSSYPSLTDYEIATVLDKAYLAVIANKLTGNNTRRAVFEGDNKAIEDIRPLLCTERITKPQTDTESFNKIKYDLSKTQSPFMYYVESRVNVLNTRLNVSLVSHQDALKYEDTAINKPWVPEPVIYLEGDYGFLLFDSFKYKFADFGDLYLTFIRKPSLFVKELQQVDFGNTKFELNDNVAQEVINIAIIMSAEIVESQRLSTKTSISSIES